MEYTMHGREVTISLEGILDAANAGAVENQICDILDQTGATSAVFDARELESITSAGLHVVMRLIKRLDSVTVLEACDEVYEALEKTGITGIARIRRQPSNLSVEGCELVGKGVTAAVYRLDSDTIAKVYNDNIPRASVEEEFNRAQTAFLAGVPTAIAYETIRVGSQFGTVFEMLEGEELLSLIAEKREHLPDLITKFAQEIRAFHSIEVDPSAFSDTRAYTLSLIPGLVGIAGTQEEVDAFIKMYEQLPERHTFLHGDCHPGNVIVRNGEFVFIDLADGGMGHPIIDLLSMCLSYKFMTMHGPETYEMQRQNLEVIRPFTFDEACLIWDTFLHVYFNTDDEAFLAKAESQIMAYAALKILLGLLDAPGSVPEEQLHVLKQRVLDYASHLEPVCF